MAQVRAQDVSYTEGHDASLSWDGAYITNVGMKNVSIDIPVAIESIDSVVTEEEEDGFGFRRLVLVGVASSSDESGSTSDISISASPPEFCTSSASCFVFADWKTHIIHVR